MNINLLKAFITVSELGSFSKAAERLFISQPALSQNIKQLENHFTVSLINRTPHSFSLTEAGKILHRHAIKLVEMTDLMEEDMKEFRSSISDTLVIGATSVIGGFALPCSLFIFKSKYPEAVTKLKLGNRRQILDQLREDLIDIAVVEGAKPDENFCAIEIHIEEMVVVTPHTAPWKMYLRLSLDQLRKAPLIIREEGSSTRNAVERVLQQVGIQLCDLNVVMELHSVDSIKAAVEAGHGISILPRITVKKELYNQTLLSVPVDELSFFQSIYIAYKKKTQSTVATEFINLMKSTSNGFC